MPKVSIVVPVYNAECYISRCIDSIRNQIEKDIEIILVDDESTDDSLKICREYVKRDNRVIVLTKKNGGPHSARKAGVNRAQSEYIAFVDADDWISDTYISNMLFDMIKYKTDCVIGCYFLYENGKNKRCVNKICTGFYEKESLHLDIYAQMLCPFNSFNQNIIPSLCAKLFKKIYLKEILNSLDEDICIGEDLACTYKYILMSKSIFIKNDNSDYFYCIDGESNTTRYDEKYFNKALRSSEFLYRTIHTLGYDFLKENIDRYRLYQIYRQIGIAINAKDRQLFKKILKDIENAAQMQEYQIVFQKIDIKHFDIPTIERWMLQCLSGHSKWLFCVICTVLYYNAKRKR